MKIEYINNTQLSYSGSDSISGFAVKLLAGKDLVQKWIVGLTS